MCVLFVLAFPTRERAPRWYILYRLDTHHHPLCPVCVRQIVIMRIDTRRSCRNNATQNIYYILEERGNCIQDRRSSFTDQTLCPLCVCVCVVYSLLVSFGQHIHPSHIFNRISLSLPTRWMINAPALLIKTHSHFSDLIIVVDHININVVISSCFISILNLKLLFK